MRGVREMSEELIKKSDAIKAIASLHILADEEKIFKVYADNPHSMTTDFEGTLIDAINAIKSIPTIEPKQGEWKPFDLTWGRSIWYCTACEESTEVPCDIWEHKPIYKYCPNCGARMKGADDE